MQISNKWSRHYVAYSFINMRKSFYLLLVILISYGCEDNPDICMEVQPTPILYLGFDKYDSINLLKVTKTFSGDDGGTLVNSRKWDSIFFSGINVDCSFNRVEKIDSRIRVVETKALPGIERVRYNKLPGIFLAPEYQIFEIACNVSAFYDGRVSVYIPEYDTIDQYFRLVDKPVFGYPNHSGGGLKILPNDPLIVSWKGSLSSDLRVHFIIETHTNIGIEIDTLIYSRLSIEAEGVGNFATSVLYDNMVSLFNRELKKSPQVVKRSITGVFLEIATASILIDPSNYRNESYNDYFPILSEGKQTVFGVVYSCATDTLKGLILHDLTKQAIFEDSQLSEFKFIKW